MPLAPATPEAMQLLMEGSIAFARIEAAGLRIDVPYLEQSIKDVQRQIAELTTGLQTSEEHKTWQRLYGDGMKLDSRTQLGRIVFDTLGHKRNPFMGMSNDVAAFEHLRLPFIVNYQTVTRLKKALSTNLLGIKREVVDGVIHPFHDLHTVESYRPSSSRPNFYNMPVRNKAISKIIRSCVIPREGHELLEVDYSTQEVRISYCYNQDPKLKYDILHGDMHRDRTKELYLLSDEEMGPSSKDPGKLCRYIGKNKFVFAQFYGSYYGLCAPDLWDAISIYDLRRTDGVSLFEHLASKGISRLGACDSDQDPKVGTYEAHVKEVERVMWEENYPVYNQWKKDWWNRYQAEGGFHTKTGFTLYGVLRRNQVLCDPIQGSAFHCQLWGLIQIQKELIRRKMRTKIVNQVYDSILFDTYKKEREDVIALCQDYMLNRVVKHWPWIIVPLGMEFELSDRSWFDKKPLEVKEVR
jgi:DNA polymerase I